MGAGLCGTNRLNDLITREMILIYVIPRMLCDLEPQVIRLTQITQLGVFYRTLLRRLQSLTERVAKDIIGVLPLEATLHICMLKLLQRIASNNSSLLHDIALRQLAVKDQTFTLMVHPCGGPVHLVQLPIST